MCPIEAALVYRVPLLYWRALLHKINLCICVCVRWFCSVLQHNSQSRRARRDMFTHCVYRIMYMRIAVQWVSSRINAPATHTFNASARPRWWLHMHATCATRLATSWCWLNTHTCLHVPTPMRLAHALAHSQNAYHYLIAETLLEWAVYHTATHRRGLNA